MQAVTHSLWFIVTKICANITHTMNKYQDCNCDYTLLLVSFCWGHEVECSMEHIHKHRPLVALADIQCFIHKSKYTIHFLVQTKICITRITFFLLVCVISFLWISWIALWQRSGTIVPHMLYHYWVYYQLLTFTVYSNVLSTVLIIIVIFM